MNAVQRIAVTTCLGVVALAMGLGALSASAADVGHVSSGGKRLKSVAERTEWMAKGSYGIMVHYILGPSGDSDEAKTKDLNRIIDAFDVDYFMKQFEASGADWLIFTIGQNSGYYNSPNAFLDKALPGRTPKRDLVLEIAKRVHKLHKRFIAYIPAETWMQKPEVQKAFGWNTEDQTTFLKNYLTFVSDYSKSLGNNCDGWWYDGCYEPVHHGKWGWENWVKAARVGNPDSIVAFNDGAFCVGNFKPVSPLQDYHAGEVHVIENGQIRTDPVCAGNVYFTPEGKVRVKDQAAKFYLPDSRFIDGVQWHALVPVDSSFCAPGVPGERCQYSVDELLELLHNCKRVEGAVTFNMPIDGSGHIPEASAAKLVAVGKALNGK